MDDGPLGDFGLEVPQDRRVGQVVVVIRSDGVAVSHVEVAQSPSGSIQSRLLSRMIVEYPVREVIGHADILEADRPPAALIQVAFVKHADFWIEAKLPGGFHIDEAAEVFSGVGDLQVAECTRSSLLECICQMLRFPPNCGSNVKDRFKLFGHDVVAQHPRSVVDIQFCRRNWR